MRFNPARSVWKDIKVGARTKELCSTVHIVIYCLVTLSNLVSLVLHAARACVCELVIVERGG